MEPYIRTRQFMVKLELNLPWRPVLAWPWGVTFVINPNTFLIVEHIESWDIDAWEVSTMKSDVYSGRECAMS